jgi:hypothetical protein
MILATAAAAAFFALLFAGATAPLWNKGNDQ